MNDNLFFNIAGVGVDAVIAARFAERGMRQARAVGYLQLSTSELLRIARRPISLTMDGEAFEHRAMLVAIANGRQYGNRLLIAPGARLDDGLLEVVVVEDLSLLGIAWRLPSLFRGTLRTGRGVTDARCAAVRCQRSGGPIPYHVDGEPRLATMSWRSSRRPSAAALNAVPTRLWHGSDTS